MRSDLPPIPDDELVDRLSDYVLQLQRQVDQLKARGDRQRDRIARLTADRDTLRDRLDAARTVRGALRTLRRLESRRAPQIVPDDPPATPQPGRGLIGRDLPDLPHTSPRRPDLRVAAIMDDFSRICFGYEFAYVAVTPAGWRDSLYSEHADLLLVESSFGGNDGAWSRKIAGFGSPDDDLTALVEWCRGRGIPTVFWNKEDPISFEWFVAAARLFDVVLTVDADTVHWYRHVLGHDRIGVLPFAAQPIIHRPPDDVGDREFDVAFAGSYYAAKHPERRTQMEYIVAPALPHGLHIYDRMGDRDDDRFVWPEHYRPAVVGSLPYAGVVEAQRRYRVFLNVNTITDSPTMCARRIFELAASGTPIISGPSRAIDEMVPRGIVHVSTSPEETTKLLDELIVSPPVSDGPSWIRDEGHTYSDRVDWILEHVD